MAVRVPVAEAEIATAWLLERFPAGFEQVELGDAVELAVFTDGVGEAELRDGFPDVHVERVEAGWEDRWKDFHRAIRVGGLWIGPPWIEAPPGEPAVVVDPGRAFGTGAHPTTRGCIQLLTTLDRGSILDAGCGSGVVSVAAARLGYAPVLAVDLDEVAVEVAAATARSNDVAIEVSQCDVLRDALPPTDVVVANIELGVVERLLDRLTARHAVTSGYLDTDTPTSSSWTHVERLELEGWAADVFTARH